MGYGRVGRKEVFVVASMQVLLAGCFASNYNALIRASLSQSYLHYQTLNQQVYCNQLRSHQRWEFIEEKRQGRNDANNQEKKIKKPRTPPPKKKKRWRSRKKDNKQKCTQFFHGRFFLFSSSWFLLLFLMAYDFSGSFWSFFLLYYRLAFVLPTAQISLCSYFLLSF